MLRQRPDDVRRYLAGAGDLDPTHPDLQALRARLARDEGDEAAAYQAFLEELRRAPTRAELWQQLSLLDTVHYKLDALEERLQALTQPEVTKAKIHLLWWTYTASIGSAQLEAAVVGGARASFLSVFSLRPKRLQCKRFGQNIRPFGWQTTLLKPNAPLPDLINEPIRA